MEKALAPAPATATVVAPPQAALVSPSPLAPFPMPLRTHVTGEGRAIPDGGADQPLISPLARLRRLETGGLETGQSRPRESDDRHRPAELPIRRLIKYSDGSGPQTLQSRLEMDHAAVDPKRIAGLIAELHGGSEAWTESDATLEISNRLTRLSPPHGAAGSSNDPDVTHDEAQHYFLSTFKTFALVYVDGKKFKVLNITNQNLHAEDVMMQKVSELVIEQGWDRDFSEDHTISMLINNSPCTRCADRIYAWAHRDLFTNIDIQFTNVYKKKTQFDRATGLLRSGGVTMSHVSAASLIAPHRARLKKHEVAKREARDARGHQHHADWIKQHGQDQPRLPALSVSSRSQASVAALRAAMRSPSGEELDLRAPAAAASWAAGSGAAASAAAAGHSGRRRPRSPSPEQDDDAVPMVTETEDARAQAATEASRARLASLRSAAAASAPAPMDEGDGAAETENPDPG